MPGQRSRARGATDRANQHHEMGPGHRRASVTGVWSAPRQIRRRLLSPSPKCWQARLGGCVLGHVSAPLAGLGCRGPGLTRD